MGELGDEIKDIIENNDVIVFSASFCRYCTKAKQLLTENNIPFVEIDSSDEQLDQLYDATGQSSVPSIWVKGTYIGGCNDGPESWMGLTKCLQSGKIQELLQK
jgi:glutaredoxin 3